MNAGLGVRLEASNCNRKPRTVLVTGSSRGIGFAIAKAFAALGDRVVLNCREDEAQLERAVAELRKEFCSVENFVGFRADVSNYDACAEFFAKAEAALGQIEILVNNAGIAHFGLFGDMTPCEIEGIISANLLSVANASHLVIPNMVRAKAGGIINISSIWGISGASCEVAYSAAKAGVNGFTKALAKELAPSNIRVNAIACGAFETRMNDRLSPHEKNAFTEDIPLGRFGSPKEAGDLAVFLASDAASYLTGQVIPLDGGVV
ncbi:MAG: 3-oxoacyl-ACP reductase FabG [Defluviitaleaceae bacterium]|nr:3-oxoacyl-ACP reductase FabG [Defluviitaleaceae bacterium]